MRPILNVVSKHIYLLLLVFFFGFLFFYRLDWTTLGSWDEAWYASIAREMLRSGNIFLLTWNGIPFYDHPPMGFWIMALTYKLIGISEYSTRLPSASAGLLSIILIYQVSIKLFQKKVIGFSAAMILGTSVWYVIRVRSGNLDSLFVFFYLLSIYLALKVREKIYWFPAMSLSFGALMLTKTLIGLSAAPVLFIIIFYQIIQVKKNHKIFLLGIGLFLALVLPWYYINYISYSDFIQHHFLKIGTRNKDFASYFHIKAELPLYYLHMGVRKWYYLWLLTMGYILVSFRFIKKNVLPLLVLNIVILYPFLTSDETQLWHLIPMYIPLALTVSYGLWDLEERLICILNNLLRVNNSAFSFIRKLLKNTIVVSGVYVCAIMFIAFWQMNIFYHEVIPESKYTPDDVDISQRVSKYDETIFLDDDFLPLALYYSDKHMRQVAFELGDRKTLVALFNNEDEPFVAITRNWALNNLKENNIDYALLEQNDSFSIISKP